MQEKKYLKWYNKLGYGSGDWAANMVYALLTSFVLIYLTDTVGLNAGIVGTLMMFSKFADGVTDVFFGSLIDKTKSKMGKARPWMLWSYIGNTVCLIAIFAIPSSWGDTAKYAYFFIAYTLLNAVFYTANNIAYASLTALITKNNNERVQMGSIRFMFSLATNLVVASITIKAVASMGGGAAGWRNVAIVYGLIGLVVNTISVLSVKEVPDEEEKVQTSAEKGGEDKLSLWESAKLLFANKYYLIIVAVYVLTYIQTGIAGIGIYYMTYILFNENLYGVFSWAINIPLIIALLVTPVLVEKWKGMYKLNLTGYVIGTIGRALVVVAGYLGSVPLMLLFTGIAAFGMGPWQGDMNAVIASCSEYTYLTKHKRVDGTMYSCTSLGIKLGGGIGIAITGWLLDLSGFDGALGVQSDSCIQMLQIMYLWVPVAITLIITFIMSKMNVERANEKLLQEQAVKSDMHD